MSNIFYLRYRLSFRFEDQIVPLLLAMKISGTMLVSKWSNIVKNKSILSFQKDQCIPSKSINRNTPAQWKINCILKIIKRKLFFVSFRTNPTEKTDGGDFVQKKKKWIFYWKDSRYDAINRCFNNNSSPRARVFADGMNNIKPIKKFRRWNNNKSETWEYFKNPNCSLDENG